MSPDTHWTRTKLLEFIRTEERDIAAERSRIEEKARQQLAWLRRDCREQTVLTASDAGVLEPYFDGTKSEDEVLQGEKAIIWEGLGYRLGIARGYGLGAMRLYEGDATRARVAFREGCHLLLDALDCIAAMPPGLRRVGRYKFVGPASYYAVRDGILAEDAALSRRLGDVLLDSKTPWKEIITEEHATDPGRDFWYVQNFAPLFVHLNRPEARDIADRWVSLEPAAKRRMTGVFPGEAAAHRDIVLGDRDAFVRDLGVHLASASRSSDVRDAGVPLATGATILVLLARNRGFSPDLLRELPRGLVRFIPATHGGTGRVQDVGHLEAESLGKDDLLVEPLYPYRNKDSTLPPSSAPVLMILFLNVPKASWESHGGFLNFTQDQTPVAIFERSELRDSPTPPAYKAVVRLTKRGYYCLLGGHTGGGLFAILARRDASGIAWQERVQQPSGIEDAAFVESVLRTYPPEFEGRLRWSLVRWPWRLEGAGH